MFRKCRCTEQRGRHRRRPTQRLAKLATYCWTPGLEGELIYWDLASAELVRKVHVGLPVHSMVIPNITRTLKSTEVYTPFAFVSVEDTSKPANNKKALRGQIRIYDLTKGHQVGCLLAEARNQKRSSQVFLENFGHCK